jgi:hypothetical protein
MVRLGDATAVSHAGTPIGYFTLNDLLNLITELRSFPELQRYFVERAKLPDGTLRTLGGEQLLYEKYLLNEGGFLGWTGFENALLERRSRKEMIDAALAEKRQADRLAAFVETVMDELSGRLNNHEEGLAPEVVRRFDSSSQRKN